MTAYIKQPYSLWRSHWVKTNSSYDVLLLLSASLQLWTRKDSLSLRGSWRRSRSAGSSSSAGKPATSPWREISCFFVGANRYVGAESQTSHTDSLSDGCTHSAVSLGNSMEIEKVWFISGRCSESSRSKLWLCWLYGGFPKAKEWCCNMSHSHCLTTGMWTIRKQREEGSSLHIRISKGKEEWSWAALCHFSGRFHIFNIVFQADKCCLKRHHSFLDIGKHVFRVCYFVL